MSDRPGDDPYERAARRTFKVVADRIDRRAQWPNTMEYSGAPGHFTDLFKTWQSIRSNRDVDQAKRLAHMQDSVVHHRLATREEMVEILRHYGIITSSSQ